jgi:GNAT superfamily N-acetyltransferase
MEAAPPRSMTIRSANDDELGTFATFWLAMFEEVGVLYEREMAADWRMRYRAYFERRIADGHARLFAAVDAGAIVGTAGAIVADGYPYAITGVKRGYVFGVRVTPEYRGRGIATELTKASVEFLRGIGCRRVRLHASPFGRPIYERLGFVPTNEMELR